MKPQAARKDAAAGEAQSPAAKTRRDESIQYLRDRGPRPGTGHRSLKKVAFRAAALILPFLLIGGLELLLRLTGFGYPSQFFISSELNGRKIVHENQQFGWRFFPPRAARTPRPVSLPKPKPPGTCRIFVFGESAAYGDPAPAFGLPRVLEVLLRNRYPKVRFEVVNAAMTAINSNVILPIAEDCAKQQGDIWVLYIGNNEVVGPYGAGTVFGPQTPSLSFIRASIALKATRLGQVFERVRQRLKPGKSASPETISLELFLDQQVRQEDPRMRKVYSHFAQNLKDIIRLGVGSGAKVVASTVASNLKDCPPFASLRRPGMNESRKAEWETAWQAGIRAEAATNLTAAIEAYSRAALIDDRFAELQFRLGRAEWRSGQVERARSHFVLARDYDALRIRADSRLNEIVREVSSGRTAEGIGFVDGERGLAARSPQGIVGREVLFEHVHLNSIGNYWLGRMLAEQIASMKPTVLAGQKPAGEWVSESECFAQLDLNDWDRFETLEILRERLEHPPFTAQLGHQEQYARLKEEAGKQEATLNQETLSAAVQSCRRALALAPEDWVLHQKLAQLLWRTGNRTAAAQEWQQVIAEVPHYPEAYYELGVLLLAQGQAGEAVNQLRRAVQLDPIYPLAFNALGRALAAQNQLPEAIRCYERALRLKPDLAEALVNLRLALAGLGTNNTGTRLKERGGSELDLGHMLKESDQVNEAIRVNSEVLRTNPQNAKAHYQLAEALRMLGRYPEAREHYAEAVRNRPDFAEAHCMLGLAMAKDGNQSGAMEQFSEALRLKPELGLAHLSLGVALAKQQRFQEAEAQFQEVLRLDPSDTNAQKYLHAARRAQGKIQ